MVSWVHIMQEEEEEIKIIDCHRTKEVQMEDNAYYTQLHEELKEKYKGEKITVDKIGGIECGKCHY